MGRNTVRITYTGDERDLVRSTRRSEREIDHLNKEGSRHFSALGRAAGVAGLAVAGGLAFGLKKSVDAAKEAQNSQLRMQTQLTALGISYDKHAKKIDRVIQQTSKLAALDDEDLQNSFTGLVRVTGDVDKGLELTALAADVARGKHISLEAATSLVTKAALGNVGALKRQGIEIPKVTTAQDALKASHGKVTEEQKKAAKAADDAATRQAAIAALQRTFAGQAEKYGKSTAGAQDELKVATENLEESIGAHLLPALATWTNRLTSLIEFSQKHARETKIVVGVLAGLAIAVFAVNAAYKVYRAGVLVATAAQWLLNAALTANPIGIVVVALAALGVGLILAWKKSETFRTVVTGVFAAVKTVVVTAVSLVLRYVGFWLDAIHLVLAAASRIPGIGGKFEAAAKGVDAARKKVDGLVTSLSGVKNKTVKVDVILATKPTGDGSVYSGEGSVGAWYDRNLSRVAATAFSAGALVFPNAFGVGASAGGLQPYIRDELAIGQSMGLRLSSGVRPGAITATGKRSLHATGEAIDMAGNPAIMAAYAHAVAGRSGVQEVIYSPVGWWHPASGWGPVTNAKIKRDHYSHVHVGATSGDGLVGDGMSGRKKRPKMHRSAPEGWYKRARRHVSKIPWGELKPAMELRIFDAEQTPGSDDDVAAHQEALDYFNWQLKQVRHYKIGPTAELAVKRAIKDQQDAIRDLQGGGSAELEAQLEQARRRLDAAQAGLDISNAFIGTGIFGGGGSVATGGGGTTVVFNNLVPDAEQTRRATEAIALGADSQPSRIPTKAFVGL